MPGEEAKNFAALRVQIPHKIVSSARRAFRPGIALHSCPKTDECSSLIVFYIVAISRHFCEIGHPQVRTHYASEWGVVRLENRCKTPAEGGGSIRRRVHTRTVCQSPRGAQTFVCWCVRARLCVPDPIG